MRLTRSLWIFLVFSSVSILLFHVASRTAYAALTENQRAIYRSGNSYFDEAPTSFTSCGGSIQTLTGSNQIFYIGDSITVGLYGSGQLLQKTQDAGYSVSLDASEDNAGNSFLTHVSGPSIEAYGGKNTDGLADLLETRLDDLGEDKVGVFVVMLGTNYYGRDGKTQMLDLIDLLKEQNPSSQILWVNTYFFSDNPDVVPYTTVNATITEVGAERDIHIVDYATAAIEELNAGKSPNMAPSTTGTDQIHLYGESSGLKSDFIVKNLPSSNGSQTSSCGGTASTGDNDIDFINAMKANGMTIHQAVGILANLYHESGNRPKRSECIYGRDNGLEKGVPDAYMDELGDISSAVQLEVAGILLAGGHCTTSNGRVIKTTVNGYGWGLVQWTPASKIINPASESGVSYDVIDSMQYQTDFLLSQLRGEALGLVEQAGVDPGTAEASRNRGFFDITDDANEAAQFFAINYERCGNCTAGNAEVLQRGAEADELMLKYGSL